MYTPTCPVCEAEAFHLGTLGSLFWFRCRACGIDFSMREVPVLSPEEVEEAIREAAREAGDCVDCLESPAMPGYEQCGECSADEHADYLYERSLDND